MSIVQTQTTSFKAELYEGVHNLLVDDIYMALYTGNANLNADTTVYSSTNEVTGTGYVAGGVQMTGITISSSGYTAYVNFANTVKEVTTAQVKDLFTGKIARWSDLIDKAKIQAE